MTQGFGTFAEGSVSACSAFAKREGKVVIGRHAEQGLGRVYLWKWLQSETNDDDDDELLSRTSWTRSAAYPIQGVCADIGLVAIALIEERLIAASITGECGLIAWIHDEFLIEVEERDVPVAKRILEESMVEAFLWAFPNAPTRGLVEAKFGRTWADTKAKDPEPQKEAAE